MCDTFVCLPTATSDRSVILGKNSDREPNEAHEIVINPATDHPKGSVRATYIEIAQVGHTHRVLLAKPYWIWGAEMGVNEHGVVIGNEAVFTKAKRESTPGLLGMDLLRLALERAETAEQAIDVITGLLVRHGQGGQAGHTHKLQYDNSYMIADRHQGWVLETVGRDWVAKQVEFSGSISNGLTLRTQPDQASPGLMGIDVAKDRSDFLYTRFSDSKARQCRTADTLVAERGSLEVLSAMRLLRDHGQPGADPGWTPARGLFGQTVCAHAGFGPIRVAQSTGSMVAHVTGDRITVWLTGTSAPCTSVFKPVWLDGGVPGQHAPGKQYDPTTLWWRHEDLHRETLLDFAHRHRLFAGERDALEEQFVAQAAVAGVDDFAAVTADCFERADRAEQQWLAAVRAEPITGRPPVLHARAWQKFDRLAGRPS